MTAPRPARRDLGPVLAPAPAEVPVRVRPDGGRSLLEVVPDPGILRSRRLSRLFTAIAGLAVCFGLFGVVGLHVMLAQGQGDLQRLQSRVQQEEDHQQRLRLEVAQLESPAGIVAAARQRLGMVVPTTVVVLAPASLANPPPTTVPAPRPTTTVAAAPAAPAGTAGTAAPGTAAAAGSATATTRP